MVQRTFYDLPAEAPAETAWEPAPGDAHTLRFGYNLADLDRLTRMSIARVYGLTIDARTRYEIAWSAIAEHLYDADAAPTPGALVVAGQNAVSGHLEDEMRHHGYDHNRGGGTKPRFAAFWEGFLRQPDPANGVVERVALYQIWAQLPDTHREVLHALAVADDYRAAARMLGKSYGAFVTAVNRARHAFYELWHEGEEPSRPWGFDRRSATGGRAGSTTYFLRQRQRQRQGTSSGRRRITASQLDAIRERRAAGDTLAQIAEDVKFSKSYLSRLLNGVLQPVEDAA